jgi:hypothetical protein
MMVIPDNPENPKAEIARIVAERARYSDEYYHIVGVNDCDFLHDDLGKVLQANIIATIVDGEEVYKA